MLLSAFWKAGAMAGAPAAILNMRDGSLLLGVWSSKTEGARAPGHLLVPLSKQPQ